MIAHTCLESISSLVDQSRKQIGWAGQFNNDTVYSEATHCTPQYVANKTGQFFIRSSPSLAHVYIGFPERWKTFVFYIIFLSRLGATPVLSGSIFMPACTCGFWTVTFSRSHNAGRMKRKENKTYSLRCIKTKHALSIVVFSFKRTHKIDVVARKIVRPMCYFVIFSPRKFLPGPSACTVA